MYTVWEIVASNAAVATILAIGAMLLSRIWKNAAAIHVLWVVVLLKLFTPPLVTTAIPFALTTALSGANGESHENIKRVPAKSQARQIVRVPEPIDRDAITAGNLRHAYQNAFTETATSATWSVSAIIAAIWIGGACCMAVAYAVRIRCFTNVVRDCEAASPTICGLATQLSSRLGLWLCPTS